MKINSTLMTGRSVIQKTLLAIMERLVEDNMNSIMADLAKSAQDTGSPGITLKIGTPIQFTGSKIYMEPAIEWERKSKSKVDGKPVSIDLNQTELEFDQDK